MNHSIFTAVLLGSVCVLVKVQAHIDIQIIACQTNDTAPQVVSQVDGEEVSYTDFKNKERIITLPEFEQPGSFVEARAHHQMCINNLEVFAKADKYPPEEIDSPHSIIYLQSKVELGRSNRLICFVNNIYPPPVNVRWIKNNVETKDGVSLSRYYPSPDATFHQFCTLSLTPEEGDVYACSVEHKGLPEPLTRIWEPEANNKPDMAATAFCGIGLTLGLLGVGVGTFFLSKANNCNLKRGIPGVIIVLY